MCLSNFPDFQHHPVIDYLLWTLKALKLCDELYNGTTNASKLSQITIRPFCLYLFLLVPSTAYPQDFLKFWNKVSRKLANPKLEETLRETYSDVYHSVTWHSLRRSNQRRLLVPNWRWKRHVDMRYELIVYQWNSVCKTQLFFLTD